jgi:hypothetical protein
VGVAIPFAIPSKIFDTPTFNKIVIRSLHIFYLGLFLFLGGKIELFGLDGIPFLIGRLVITIAAYYTLMGNFSLKIKTYLCHLVCFGIPFSRSTNHFELVPLFYILLE